MSQSTQTLCVSGLVTCLVFGISACADVTPDFIDGGEYQKSGANQNSNKNLESNQPEPTGGDRVITDPAKLTEDFVPDKDTRVKLTENEWKKLLTEEEYNILREAGTEAKHSGKHIGTHAEGVYHCAACGAPLYRSNTKFASEAHGWPSYYRGIDTRIGRRPDHSLGMDRTEVYCKTCGSHLGHVFQDAPDQPTGERHCINSVALDFKPTEEK